MLLAQEIDYFSLFCFLLFFSFLPLPCAALMNLELSWNCSHCHMSYLIVQIAFYSKDKLMQKWKGLELLIAVSFNFWF